MIHTHAMKHKFYVYQDIKKQLQIQLNYQLHLTEYKYSFQK